jgi:MbtH protein
VVNGEGQYSVLMARQELPAGWEEFGFTGSREECLVHISKVWTDMTPRSLGQK